MMKLIDDDPERNSELRGYVHDVELPNHLMYHLILEFISDYKQTNQHLYYLQRLFGAHAPID